MKHFLNFLLVLLACAALCYNVAGCAVDAHYDSASITTNLKIDASSMGKTFKVHKKLQFDRDLSGFEGLYVHSAALALDPDIIAHQNGELPETPIENPIDVPPDPPSPSILKNYQLNVVRSVKLFIVNESDNTKKELICESRDGYLQGESSRLVTTYTESVLPFIENQRVQLEIQVELNQKFLFDYMKTCGYSVEDADNTNDENDIQCPLDFDLSVWFEIR